MRQRPADRHQSFDFDQSLVLARMEVRRLVVAVKHPSNDSDEAALPRA